MVDRSRHPRTTVAGVRLYLSSFRLGRCADVLVDLAGPQRTAAVIANACDLADPAERKGHVQRELDALGSLGFTVEELDLRRYLGGASATGELAARLSGYGLVWVRGGNPFVLLRLMRATGFDALLLDLLARDRLVYGGYSGGVDVLAPSLRGFELLTDPAVAPPGLPAEVPWDGLGVLPYAFAAHYRSDHPETELVEKLVRYYIDNHVLFKAVRDGQVLVIRDGTETVL
jgi:dipeptidase E